MWQSQKLQGFLAENVEFVHFERQHVESSWREREGTHSYVRTDGPHGLQSLWLRLEKLLLWHHPRTGIVFFKECTQELGLLV